MKKILTITIFTAILTSCSTAIFDTEEDNNDKHLLTLTTYSGSNAITYPIDLYAYSGGNEIEHITVTSSEEKPVMELSTGNYSIYAVSGSRDFTDKGYSTTPLMIGSTIVTLGKTDKETAITMQYAVAKVSVALSDVPDNITAVQVEIGQQYNYINEIGELSGSKEIKLSCKKLDATWVSDTIYVLPGCGTSTSIEIGCKTNEDDVTVKQYSYEYPQPLQAGCPYNFKGSYDSGITYSKISFSLEASGWSETVEHSFTFGEGANENQDVIPTDASTFNVDELPTPCSAWNEHVVATIDEEGNALLLSLKEWSDVATNCENSSNRAQANNYAIEYIESELSGWKIPTLEEAKKLLNSGYTYDNYNKVLNTVKGTKITKGKNTYNYYLCDEATNIYSFENPKSTKSINANDKYYLRLVKPVKFITNQ